MDRIGSKVLLLTQRVDAIDKIVKHHGDNVQVLEKLHKLCLALDQDGMKVLRLLGRCVRLLASYMDIFAPAACLENSILQPSRAEGWIMGPGTAAFSLDAPLCEDAREPTPKLTQRFHAGDEPSG